MERRKKRSLVLCLIDLSLNVTNAYYPDITSFFLNL